MSEITNSKRTLFQATYSPIDVRDPPVATRAWEKWTYFASLAAQIGDFGDFKKRIQNRLAIAGDDQLRKQLNQAMTDLNTLEALIPHVRTPDALSSVSVYPGTS